MPEEMAFFPTELLKRGLLLGPSPLDDPKSPFFSSSREKAAKLPLSEDGFEWPILISPPFFFL